MQKVQMTVHGREALVDADMVNLMTKKQELVRRAMEIKALGSTMSAQAHLDMTDEVMGKIIRLNKRIRKNVIFL